ncbi:hypothetical protein PPERSA_02295 [Pseudocohnilembus persalinus]|uniref:Inhibitor of apoptosis-promoting Bax1 protein n=1 Tax=Pseudocohnilembus persalinus TaxID=266149 RepID=A0A0V0QHP3_PSEPJ|nr:hypothetical protein PPERSA_02295 [Pseudocohnilembus persalinus]|eukprot:KRX01767.1 hypothetical protein PPERSA_02295 [Pseudocohnilembus persalinus]
MQYNYPNLEEENNQVSVQQPTAPVFNQSHQVNQNQNPQQNFGPNNYYPGFNQPQMQAAQIIYPQNQNYYQQQQPNNNVVGFADNFQQGLNLGTKQQFMHNYGHDTENQIGNHNNHNYFHDQDYKGEDSDISQMYGQEDIGSLSKGQQIKFIRKVYLILLTQIAISCLFVIQAKESRGFKYFIIRNPFVTVLSLIALTATCYALSCYQSLCRKVPTNYILLFIFTFSQSYLLAATVLQYDVQSVLLAGGITFFMFLGITTYALWTKEDFTIKGGSLFMGLITLSGGLFLNMFIQSSFVNLMLNVGFIFLFGIYLIYDTQMIVGGHKHSFTYDDYIIAALQMYIDIINIFLYTLRLFGKSDN